MGQFVNLTAADGFVFPAYVAQPAGTAKGAVVVIQEIFGVNAHIQAVADGYAKAGYLAVAPATFHRVKTDVNMGYSPDDMAAGFALKTAVEGLPAPGVMQDLQAAVNYAASAGKVGLVGYCWGGLLTWRGACSLQGVSAATTYYGGGMTSDAEMLRQPICPVLSHFGDQDHWISLDSVQAFGRAHPEVKIHVYAANHGFNCDHRGAFNAAAAELALTRTLDFFGQHLH